MLFRIGSITRQTHTANDFLYPLLKKNQPIKSRVFYDKILLKSTEQLKMSYL